MLNPKDKEVIVRSMAKWAEAMQHSFDVRFGKKKIGHVIITLDTGSEPTVNWSTNLRDSDFKRLLKMLAERVDSSRILRPYDA